MPGPTDLRREGEREQHYTIFTDSVSAIERVVSDRLGPGQHLAVEATEAGSRPTCRGNSVTIRWTPTHLGVERHEVADLYEKGAGTAESELHAVDRAYMRETSLAHMARLATEAKTSDANSWTASHIRRRRGYKPTRGGRLRQELWHERKALAGRYYQLLSRHAVTGSFLYNQLNKIPSDRYWQRK